MLRAEFDEFFHERFRSERAPVAQKQRFDSRETFGQPMHHLKEHVQAERWFAARYDNMIYITGEHFEEFLQPVIRQALAVSSFFLCRRAHDAVRIAMPCHVNRCVFFCGGIDAMQYTEVIERYDVAIIQLSEDSTLLRR